MSEKAKPNCYECKFRREVPGSAHSRCAHPSLGESEPLDEVAAIFASVGRMAPFTKNAHTLNVTGNPIGVQRGWFIWPYNFDPTWLETCDGFEPKQPVTSEQKGTSPNR